MSLLGIEIGVTHCSAVIFSLDGQVQGRGWRKYLLISAEPGARELDAELVMQALVREAIIDAVDDAGQTSPVQALAVASQGEAIVPLDRDGQTLGPALTTFDSRPAEEARHLAHEVGLERIQQITGLPVHPMYSLAKLLWWKHRYPETLEKAWKCVSFSELLLMRLGFEPVMDYSMAGRTMALDLRQYAWSPEMLEAAGNLRGAATRACAGGHGAGPH